MKEIKNIFKDKSFEEALREKTAFLGKYETAAKEILEAVGLNNYSKYYNCFTKLRFVFLDKEKIDIEKLEKIEAVAKVTFTNNELQLAIGGEVTQVKDAIDAYYKNKAKNEFKLSQESNSNSNDAKKMKLLDKFLDMMKNIMVPIMPFFIIGGLFGLVNVILQMTDLIQILTPQSNFTNQNIGEIVWFSLVSASGTFMFIGLYWSSVKYFGGSSIYGIIFGLALVSPILFRGTMVADPNTGQIGAMPFTLVLWEIEVPWSQFPIAMFKIGPLYASFFSAIIAGAFIAFSEKSLKKITTNQLFQFMFLPPILLAVSGLAVMFVIAPIVQLVETSLSLALSVFIEIPYGIGALILGVLWPAIVLFGFHAVITMLFIMPQLLDPGNPTVSVPIMVIDEMTFISYIGVSIGIYIFTQNAAEKQQIINGIPICLLGTKEPLQFGVILPNIKSFGVAMLANGIGSWIAFTLGSEVYPQGSGGVLTVFRALGPDVNIASMFAMLAGQFATLLSALFLMVVIYKYHNNEWSQVKKSLNKIRKIYKKNNFEYKNDKDLIELMEKINQSYIPENKKLLIEFSKTFSKKQSIEITISKLIKSFEFKQAKMANKFNKLIEKDKKIAAKILFDKIKNLKPNEKISILESKKEALEKEFTLINEKINKMNAEVLLQSDKLVKFLDKKFENFEKVKFDSNIYNAIHWQAIKFKLIEKK